MTVVGHLAHATVHPVRALLHQLVVDVHGHRVLRILVAPRIHLHTDVVVTLRSQVRHVRYQLATRQNRILDVEYRRVSRYLPYRNRFRMQRGVAHVAVRTHHRVVVLHKTVYDPVEARLLEQDVHLRAGVQSAQTDQVAPALVLLHRELPAPVVQRVILQNNRAGRRVQLRNHVHEAVLVKHQTRRVPMDAVRGIGYLKTHVNIRPAVLPPATLDQVEPVVRTLRIVDDRVRVHVRVQHQERQVALCHARPQRVPCILRHLHAPRITAQTVHKLIDSRRIPRRHRLQHRVAHARRIKRQHTRASGDQPVADVKLRILAHVRHKNTVAVNLILDTSLRAGEALGLHRHIMVVLRAHTVVVKALRRHRQRRQIAVKREVVHRVVQQAVTDRIRETETVHIILDHLDTDPVVARLAALAAQVDEQGVIMKHIQKVRVMLGWRYPPVARSRQRLVVVRHREMTVVGHLAHATVHPVSALLQQLVVDVHRNSVLGILVAPGIHLHTNVVVTVRSQVGHVRNKLATRQNRILHVENRSVVGEPRYNLNTRIPRGCADIAGIGLRRVVVLPEHIYDAVEASLLEQDVHLRAGVKGTQTDKVAPAILLNLHRERASPSVKSVVLRNLSTVGRVKLRNHVHEAVVVERQTHIAPVHAIRGVLYHILQIHI